MYFIPTDVVASSVPCRFLVGPNEREFTIHSALFTQQSPIFERLTNGNFTEATEKCVKWNSEFEATPELPAEAPPSPIRPPPIPALFDSLPPPSRNETPEELKHYTNTFLSHVRLQWTLEPFTLYDERVNDVVALLDYCYENSTPEELRNLVTLYAACRIDKLWKSEKFCALVEAHSELSMALLGLMVNEL
ncbi:hypothetical protein V8C34DRAFT_317318 [Trichoderma compactum]